MPECEAPDRLTFPRAVPKPNQTIWKGDDPDKKGLGVFSYSALDLIDLEPGELPFRYVAPIRVGGAHPFNLLAVWGQPDPDLDRGFHYAGQVSLAIEHYPSLFKESVLLAGDFNDSPSFIPRWGGPRNIQRMADTLRPMGIVSLYHAFHQEEWGAESRSTHFWQYRRDRAYHVDYCFASGDWAARLQDVWVGSYDDWRPAPSDHAPMLLTFRT